MIAEDEKITVNGRPFTVEIDEDGGVLVDGVAYDVAVKGDTAQVGDESHTMHASGLSAGLQLLPLRSGRLSPPRSGRALARSSPLCRAR